MSEAKKFDGEKLRMELIPADVLEALATVLGFGAKKYGDWNWANGFDWSRLYGATQRHLTAWHKGEDNDQETGLSHLWHALAEIAFLVVHEQRGLGKDDRWRPAGGEWVQDRDGEWRWQQQGCVEHCFCKECRE